MNGSSPKTALSTRASWTESDRIKRESRHIYNKLHSIVADSEFVRRIALKFPGLLLTANLRCGAWYTEPVLTSAVSYFKSTDGHTHQWSFSLKRSNLHLLPDILDAGGCIIVDSTRRGKSMPDALSKTIPIWCAVLNVASHKLYGCPDLNNEADLHTPQWVVPPSEHDQIRSLLHGFTDLLVTSDLAVPRLDLPLRPVFVTPQHEATPLETDKRSFIPVVLVSASRLVHDSSELAQYGQTSVYVQGAGDDHENWARGLTPDLFWANVDDILACSKDTIASVVDKIVQSSSTSAGKHWFTPKHDLHHTMQNLSLTDTSDPTSSDVEVGQTGVAIGCRSASHVFTNEELSKHRLVVHITSHPRAENPDHGGPADVDRSRVMHLRMTPNRKGLNAVRALFPLAVDRAYAALTARDCPTSIMVCCEDGRDLSGSLVVAILSSCFDESRSLIRDAEHKKHHCQSLSKDTTRRRLHWLVSSDPRASPSRAFLLRVNEMLLSGQYRPEAQAATTVTQAAAIS